LTDYTPYKNPSHLADYEWHNDQLCTRLFKNYDDTITADFDVYLYLTPLHVQTQTSRQVNFFFLYRQKDLIIPIAIFQCCDYDNNWFSPFRAPFGSIQCHANCTIAEIDFFLKCISSYVQKQRGLKLVIQHYPDCYRETPIDLANEIYLPNGFKVIGELNNQSIPVSSKMFSEVICRMERRRLNKCVNSHFISKIESDIQAKEIYNFLFRCRSKKGYSISLTEANLEKLLVTFRNEIIVFSVKKDNLIVALSVTVRVNKKVLYNFLTDSLPEFNTYSPAVLLTQRIYNYCQDQKIQVLDLGTSVDHHGTEKAGLVRFKENLGGVRGRKLTFSKDFHPSQ